VQLLEGPPVREGGRKEGSDGGREGGREHCKNSMITLSRKLSQLLMFPSSTLSPEECIEHPRNVVGSVIE